MKRSRYTTSDYLSFEEISRTIKYFKKIKKYKIALLVEFGTKTMLRYSDLSNLKWDQILNKNTIVLNESKTKKRREITLGQTLSHSIITAYGDLGFPDSNGLVFDYSIQYINRVLKKVGFELKIKNKHISTHSFRKSGARYIWQSNGHSDEYLIKLSNILNHSSTEITRRYLGISKEEIKNIYEAFDEMI